MAIVPTTLFFQNRKYSVGALTFDLILSESHNFSNTISTHVIEDGSEISDHIKNELENGSLTGMVTNHSINVFGLASNRAQDAFDLIYDIWKSRILVNVVTVMKSYKDVAITNIDISRSESTGEAISMNISFRQLNRRVRLSKTSVDVNINISNMSNDLNRQSAVKANISRTVTPQ